MANFVLPIYDDARAWILKKREKEVTWDEILWACKKDGIGLRSFLDFQIDNNDWPEMTNEEWKELVQYQKEAEEETIRIDIESGAATIHDEGTNNEIKIPIDPKTSWQKYKEHLREEHFSEDTISTIERSTIRILKRLSLDTKKKPAVKGLVIGNVQSGKTANMAALMAMAADWGWNMFIILSGSIENLRKQTQERLFGDLNQEGSRLTWRSLEHLSKNMPVGYKAQDYHFNPESIDRYMTVTLKNGTRLKKLLEWMQESPAVQKQMKVLVIDDECDQAGVNTANENEARKRINGLICNLVNGNDSNGKPSVGYSAMNYIGYTATPYANILNEGPGESLYPKNFISTLKVSKEYFGPQQIFGVDDSDYDGIDIIKNISDNDLEDIKSIHKGSTNIMPKSLEDAICWFLCGVACMRHWGVEKPISMLVHTSQKTNHHSNVANIIENWISYSSKNDLIRMCGEIWDNETKRFTKKDFHNQYPDYAREDEQINDYPNFEDIKNELDILLSGTRISQIPFDSNEQVPQYHNGIHLCVDNSRNNGIENDMLVRLVYPKKDSMPNPAPAFIVVGGATLSRGLTIEGLISSYFLRSVKQSDTLMQMGRWFGYRRGYELLPRIWLTSKAVQQYQFLSTLDQNLRDEIHNMEVLGLSPEHYGPRILESPKTSFIRIVAKNRMQAAVNAEMDFRGAQTQTHIFDNDLNVLESNLNLTKEFLTSLGNPFPKKDCNKHSANSIVWQNVEYNHVCDFLRRFQFQKRQNVFSDIEPFVGWIEEVTKSGGLTNWNVVLSGKDDDSGSTWHLSKDLFVKKVTRNQKLKNKEPNILKIGALRIPKDLIADVDLEGAPDELIQKTLHFNSSEAANIREAAGLGSTPQLLIYIVDKDSKAQADSKTRTDLEAVTDVVGICINVPGGKGNTNQFVKYITVDLSQAGPDTNNPDLDDTDED